MRYIQRTLMAVAIFPQTMMALVAMIKPSIIVPVSPISPDLFTSDCVMKNVVGMMIARNVRRNFEFSCIIGSWSTR